MKRIGTRLTTRTNPLYDTPTESVRRAPMNELQPPARHTRPHELTGLDNCGTERAATSPENGVHSSSIARRAKLPTSPGTASVREFSASRALEQAPQPYVTRSGQTFQPTASLPAAERNALLDANDPVRKLGLTDAFTFYRAMDKRWLKPSGNADGIFFTSGYPDSVAHIVNHLAWEEPPMFKAMKDYALSQPDGPERKEMLQDLKGMESYQAAEMYASDLPYPSLNVMYGSEASKGASGYLKANRETGSHVLIQMTLGDIRRAGGDQVFFDIGAARKIQIRYRSS